MIPHLNTLDIVILIIVFLSILFGLIKGFIRELFSLAFFIIAVVLSFLFYHDVGSIFVKKLKDRDVSNFLGFIIIFVIILVIGSLVTYFIKKIFILGPLKSIDRIFGGVFGLVRGVLISAIICFGLIVFPANEKLVKKSTLSPYVLKTIAVFLNLLPEKYRKKIKYFKTNDRQKNYRASRTV